MKLNVLDKSNYLKGLLVLIGKDKKISENENDFIMQVGKTLGFDREFCQEAISTLLDNKYISQEPPMFSQKSFAESFLLDGLKVLSADKSISTNEISFLQLTAKANKVEDNWFRDEFESVKLDNARTKISLELEVTKYL